MSRQVVIKQVTVDCALFGVRKVVCKWSTGPLVLTLAPSKKTPPPPATHTRPLLPAVVGQRRPVLAVDDDGRLEALQLPGQGKDTRTGGEGRPV